MTANNSAYQTASEITESIKAFADDVRATTPLVHCITNYVTVESCANAVLAVGASPIMSDEPADVVDITSICNALVLNIGTLNMQTIAGMKAAGARAAELEHAIVLDPVGAGASALRTQTAGELLDSLPVALVRYRRRCEPRICRAQWVRVPGSHHGFGLHAFRHHRRIYGARERQRR